VQVGTLLRVSASWWGSLFLCLLTGSADLQVVSFLLTLTSSDNSNSQHKHPENVGLNVKVYHPCLRPESFLGEEGSFLGTISGI